MHHVRLNSFFHYEIRDLGDGDFVLREYPDDRCDKMRQRGPFEEHEGRELLRFKATDQLQVSVSNRARDESEEDANTGSFPPVLNVNGATNGVMCGDDFIGWHLELRDFYHDEEDEDGYLINDGLPNWPEDS